MRFTRTFYPSNLHWIQHSLPFLLRNTSIPQRRTSSNCLYLLKLRLHAVLSCEYARNCIKPFSIMWTIHGLGWEWRWYDFWTCDVSLTEKTITLSNIVSDRIIWQKIRCSREWAKEIKDEDFQKWEFVWYYQKSGMPYRFRQTNKSERQTHDSPKGTVKNALS